MISITQNKVYPLAIAAFAAMVVALLGGSMTDLGPWYQSLDKPAWQPPAWLFAPAWTLIFALIALSAVEAWVDARSDDLRGFIIGAYLFNASLNILWSMLFFRMQRPDWALIEVCLLWLSIVMLIFLTWRISKRSCYLLLPYLVWVSFAGFLNYTVFQLNQPFF